MQVFLRLFSLFATKVKNMPNACNEISSLSVLNARKTVRFDFPVWEMISSTVTEFFYQATQNGFCRGIYSAIYGAIYGATFYFGFNVA